MPRSQVSTSTLRARRAPTPQPTWSRLPAEMQHGEGGWTHCRRNAQGYVDRGRHAVSHPRIELKARPSRRGGRAVPLRVRPPRPACGPPTLTPAHVRMASSRDGAGGSEWGGKELRGWRRTSVPWAPREPMTVCRGARLAAAALSLDLPRSGELRGTPWGRRPGSRGCAHRAAGPKGRVRLPSEAGR